MIIHADCRIVQGLEFDHVFTDPPYSAHVHEKAVTSSMHNAGKNELGFDPLMDDLLFFISFQVAEAKSWSVIFSDWQQIWKWQECVEGLGGKLIRPIPWIRWSCPQFSGDRPPSGSEAVLLFWGKHPGKKKYNGPGNLTHFDNLAVRGKDKHKTQKPLDLCMEIVDYFSEPGESVFDPCAGRGTFELACELLGRNCLSVEIDQTESEKAEARILQPTKSDIVALDRYTERQEKRTSEMQRMYATKEKTKARYFQRKTG